MPVLEPEYQAIVDKIASDYPFSPLGFIKGASIEGLRKCYFGEIFRTGADLEHMVFHWRDDAGAEWVIAATHLKWDSRWFGKSIVRLDLVAPTAAPFNRPYARLKGLLERLAGELRSRGHDYVFVNVPVNNLGLVKSLGEAGFALTETRVTYWLENVGEFQIKKRSPTRAAESRDVTHLGKIAAESDNPYDRFHADEYFDKDLVYRLMQEWVNASVNGGYADSVLVPDVEGKDPAAVITALYHRDKWEMCGCKASQIMFMAAAANMHGRLWASRLLPEMTLHLRSMGAEIVYLTTQTPNRVVIRAVEQIGYRFGEAGLIFRKVLS